MNNGFNPTGIVVLFNVTEEILKGEPRDLIADQGVIACAEAVTAALQTAGYRVAHVPLSGDVELTLVPYTPHEWMVFNLAEGMSGRLFEEARIAWALEAMGYAFTGSDGQAIARSLNKVRAKALLESAGVRTPAWRLFRSPEELHDGLGELRFPLIVKPVAEDASLGIDANAVVHTANELRERVLYVIDRYRQAALVEAFITGREFNVSLIGNPPEVLPMAEIDFSAIDDPDQCIVSFAAKWEQDSFEYQHTPVICPANVDSDLESWIRSAARQAWDAIGCRGYARVDMRVDESGLPYVLEVNCNPDLSPDAGFFRATTAVGCSYQDMVVQIVEAVEKEEYVRHTGGLKQRWPTHPAYHRAGRRLHADRSIVRARTVERLSHQRRS